MPYLDPAVEAEDDEVVEGPNTAKPNGVVVESNGVKPKGLKEKPAEKLVANGIAVNDNGYANGH